MSWLLGTWDIALYINSVSISTVLTPAENSFSDEGYSSPRSPVFGRAGPLLEAWITVYLLSFVYRGVGLS